MIHTTVTIQRPEGTAVATGLAAQIEHDTSNHSLGLPRDDLGHNRDFIDYTVYFAWVPTVSVRRRDVLIDERNTDPLTNALAKFRVVHVERFDNDHIEAHCQAIIGS